MCDVRCTAQTCSWDSLEIQGAGARNCLSLSERGSKIFYCRAGWHHISLRVARGLFDSLSCVQSFGCERLPSFRISLRI